MFDPPIDGSLAEWYFVLTGTRPPEAKYVNMQAAADTFHTASGRTSGTLVPMTGDLVANGLTGWSSEAAAAYAKSMEPLTAAPPYYLPTLADQYEQVAQYLETTADEFVRMKINAIVILTSLLVSLAIDIALTFYFGEEVGLAALASELVIFRFLLTTVIGRLLLRILMATLETELSQVARAGIGEAFEAIALDEPFDPSVLVQAVEVGALGGALGLVLMPLEHVLGDVLGSVLVDGADAVLSKVLGTELGDVG